MTEPVSGSSNDYYLPEHKTAVKSNQGLADPEAFLKILVAQMKYQNPMQPQDSGEFISQLTQMASMEQMYNVSRSMDKMAAQYEISRYFELIGRHVSLFDGEGIVSGRVGGVAFSQGKPYFYLAGAPGNSFYTLEQLTDIKADSDINMLLPYLSLVGMQVTVKDGEQTVTGIVEKVLLQDGHVMLSIDDQIFNAAQIIELISAPEANPAPAADGDETPAENDDPEPVTPAENSDMTGETGQP